MARPNKEGLNYFPLDCKMDDKIYMVEVELGLEGFALFIKLLMKIYNENYYIKWDERKAKIFVKGEKDNMLNVIKIKIKKGRDLTLVGAYSLVYIGKSFTAY